MASPDYTTGWGWVRDPRPRWPKRSLHHPHPPSYLAWMAERARNSELVDSVSGVLWYHAWAAFCQQWIVVAMCAMVGRANGE